MQTISSILNSAPGTKLALSPAYFVLTDGTAKTVPSLLGDRALCAADKVKVFIDHETPCGSETHADRQKELIDFAVANGCELFNGYGTNYQLMLDRFVKDGEIVAHCGDFGSVFGAVGALAVKCTPEELAAAMVEGTLNYTGPERVELCLAGALKAPACAKDAALCALRLLGDTAGKLVLVSGAEALPVSERIAFFQLLSLGGCDAALPAGACGEGALTLDLTAVVPAVAGPAAYLSAVPAAELHDVAVSAVFIGGCSAGRIEDIRAAAEVIRGRRIQRKIRGMVAFATTEVYIQAANEGLINRFLDAGFLVMNQGCSACYAHSQGVVDDKDVVLSAGSRPLPNCMGAGNAPTYLCSAATAVESAITGFITPAGE